jgi:hypothetical protein
VATYCFTAEAIWTASVIVAFILGGLIGVALSHYDPTPREGGR